MVRSRAALAAILCVPIALAACGPQEEQIGPDPAEREAAANRAPSPPPLAEPPPMVVSSPAYRCDDSRALYVDVMSDDAFVNVRDRRPDIPVRLNFDPETERYEGEGRSLSGTGETVRYSAPGRPEQTCRATAE